MCDFIIYISFFSYIDSTVLNTINITIQYNNTIKQNLSFVTIHHVLVRCSICLYILFLHCALYVLYEAKKDDYYSHLLPRPSIPQNNFGGIQFSESQQFSESETFGSLGAGVGRGLGGGGVLGEVSWPIDYWDKYN